MGSTSPLQSFAPAKQENTVYSDIDRETMKSLNRVDKRRRMKYRERDAEELRFQREEVEGPEDSHEGQRPRASNGYASYYR